MSMHQSPILLRPGCRRGASRPIPWWVPLLVSSLALTTTPVFTRAWAPAQTATLERPAASAQVTEVRRYIKRTWKTLTRSLADLPAAAPDPKMPHTPGEPWPVYIAADENRARVEREVTRALSHGLPQGDRDHPAAIRPVDDQGARAPLSARTICRARRAIQRDVRVGQLFHDGRPAARRRTRAGASDDRQPPLSGGALRKSSSTPTVPTICRDRSRRFSRMVLDVYGVTRDRKWLAAAWPVISASRLLDDRPTWPATPASRATTTSAKDRRRKSSRRKGRRGPHPLRPRARVLSHPYDHRLRRRLFYDRARDELTPAFYKGDRSMRESGFDPSNRFGPFSARHHQLRARVPEQPALPARTRSRHDCPDARLREGRRRVGRARRGQAGARESPALGRGSRSVLRLPLPERASSSI